MGTEPANAASLGAKAALVTGASRGLGLEAAIRLAGAEMHVALLGRDRDALEAAAAAVEHARPRPDRRVLLLPADLSSNNGLDAAYEDCAAAFGGIDVLVNNAAVQGPIGAFESVDWNQWVEVFTVDFFAAARLCRLVIPGMRRAGWGKIINLSGGGAAGPRPHLSAYACAKTALVRLTETLAVELRGTGIDANAVAPGAMKTRMLEELLAAGPEAAPHEYAAALKRSQSGGASPAKAADLIAFLASPASDGISGRLLSAVWDDWHALPALRDRLADSDLYTLRRVTPVQP